MKSAHAKLLLFWDYDTQWGADRSRSAGGSKTWGSLEFENTERLLEIHAEYSVPACFAVVGAAAKPGVRPYHDPTQIRRIHKAGHEVGSHSFRHDWLPGLNRQELRATLADSKDALEQCIGTSVLTFVPPYNQPFDFVQRGSISLSERREAGSVRMGLKAVCEELKRAGYGFCRVAYRPWQTRVREALLRRRIDQPSELEVIAGVTCVRLNTPGGFDSRSADMLGKCASGGYAVVYGHPHSVFGGGSQDVRHLIPFLKRVQELEKAGMLHCTLPRDVLNETRTEIGEPACA